VRLTPLLALDLTDSSRSHVLRDLCPYICVYEDCDHEDTLFRSFADWTRHMKVQHTQTWWSCTECQSKEPSDGLPTFHEPEQYITHLHSSHGGELTKQEMELVVRYGVRREPLLLVGCVFCDWRLPAEEEQSLAVNQPALLQHMANDHLKILALNSLPWTRESNLLASSAGSTTSSGKSSVSGDYRRELIKSLPNVNAEDALPNPNASSLAQIEQASRTRYTDEDLVVSRWLEERYTAEDPVEQKSELDEPRDKLPMPRVYILLMGPTGVGKSTFIRTASGNKNVGIGHGLRSRKYNGVMWLRKRADFS